MVSNFGLHVKVLREKANLSQEELARKLGYSTHSSIAKIELGQCSIPVHKIPRFAEALGCSQEELINYEELPVVEHTNAYLEDVEKFASLQSILEMLSKMDAKQILKVEKVIRTLSED